MQIPNESEELFPGAYAQVALKLTGETGFYTIPANALLFRAEGAAVGVVDLDGRVEIRKITVSLKQGDKLQISGRLSETDQVIVNPSDSLAAGMVVNVLRPKQPASGQKSAFKSQPAASSGNWRRVSEIPTTPLRELPCRRSPRARFSPSYKFWGVKNCQLGL